MGSAEPSQSAVDKHKGTAAGGRPGPAPSRGGGVRASEGTNPCTRPSFATKNVFDVLQDLSESIGGSPGPQLDAADGQPEPIVHDLHQSLVELLDRDADSQRIQFEFAEFAANSFATRIRCEFGVKFRVLRIRGEFGLRIRRRQAPAAARALF